MDMTIAEKVSYIKGLAEGLKVDESTAEGKIIAAIIDVLGDIAVNIEDIDSDLADLTDVVNDVEEAVYDLEDEVYGEDEDCCCDDDCCDDEDDMYEITCPNCNNTITTDFDVISSGSIDCPNCGEKLEFDLSALDDCDCGCHE
ncbi:MAG: CD1247 N-terminal domain-containing protein [Ruminiclostridium sp.]